MTQVVGPQRRYGAYVPSPPQPDPKVVEIFEGMCGACWKDADRNCEARCQREGCTCQHGQYGPGA